MQPLISPFQLGDLPAKIPWWRWIFGSPWGRYYESIKRQIDERGEVKDEIWGTADRLQIARKIESIIAEACWGETFKFHPDDPYLVVGEWEIGDLSEIECVMEIEEQFAIHIDEDETRQLLDRNATFGQFVDFVLEKSSNAPPI